MSLLEVGLYQRENRLVGLKNGWMSDRKSELEGNRIYRTGWSIRFVNAGWNVSARKTEGMEGGESRTVGMSHYPARPALEGEDIGAKMR